MAKAQGVLAIIVIITIDLGLCALILMNPLKKSSYSPQPPLLTIVKAQQNKKPLTAPINRGFSLVEMLVVIAVIGVIAAIALPNIGSVNGSAQTAVGKRRAQEIVSVFAAGQAAGVPSFLAATSVRTAQDAVGTGGYGDGNMSSVFFKVQGVTQNEDNAKPVPARTGYYLGWSNGALVYDSAGGHFN